MATKLFGQYIESGSIPVTALSGGVVSSSAQIVASLPTGALSSSTQVDYTQLQNIPASIVSTSTQVTTLLPVGTVSSSAQVDFTTISNTPTLVSTSSQITAFDTVGGNTLATTGSNTFTGVTTFSDTTNTTNYLDGAVTVAGGVSVQKDMRISGSMTINGLLTVVSMSSQYVTSSQYNVGVSKITLNDDDTVRFAGISIYDSGSSSPTSASIFWDSLQHRFIYENLSGSSYNSAIIIAGPKNTGSLGSEAELTTGYIPYATGGDHIDNSVMYQSDSRIGVGVINPSATFQVQGNVSASSFTGSLSGTVATAAQTNITSVGTLSSLTVSGTTTAGKFVPTANTTAGNGMFLPATNTLGFSVNGSQIITTGLDGTNSYINLSGTGLADAVQLYAGYTGTNSFLAIGTKNSGTLTPRVRIDSSGNVGIGTTSPSALLELKRSGDGDILIGRYSGGSAKLIYAYQSAADGYLEIRTGADDVVTKLSGYAGTATYFLSNVGIGTTDPNSKLHVIGNAAISDALVLQRDGSSLYLNVLRFWNGSGVTPLTGGAKGDILVLGNQGGDPLVLATNNAERVRIDSSGNVGIGITDTSGYKLSVNGSSRLGGGVDYGSDTVLSVAPGVVNFDAPGIVGGRFKINSSGNVGIGITEPTTILDVAGKARLRPATGVSITSTATTNILTDLELYSTSLVAVTVYWNNNANGQKSFLLMVGAGNTAWGVGSVGTATVIASADWSSGYVGSVSFGLGGSGTSRTLQITMGNAPSTGDVNVSVYTSVLLMR